MATKAKLNHAQTITPIFGSNGNWFQTYGDSVCQYFHPQGTKAVRVRMSNAPYADTKWCTERPCYNNAPDGTPADGSSYCVETRTGSRGWDEGEVFTRLLQHTSFSCAMKHMARIHE